MHPSAEQLTAFSLGKVNDAELARIAAHLADCPDCCARLDGLASPDALLERLQKTESQLSFDQGDASQRGAGVRRIQQLLRSHETVAEEDARSPEEAGLAEPPPSSGAPSRLLKQIGEYDIEGEVGRGGMGVVYKARHRGLKRLVALKMILAGEFASPMMERRFQLEAELAARVQHPNIVQVYEIGTHQGRPFLVQEWVEGGNLARRMAGQAWDPREAAQLIEVLARAIHAAHCQGVVHRDLKPANVLIADCGLRIADSQTQSAIRNPQSAIPKITDFGLARAMHDEKGLTRTGVLVGTPAYMAPEQTHGDGRLVGPTADVYALGVVLFELLTGRQPFGGDSALSVLQAVANDEPPSLRQLQPDVPRDLEAVVLHCLHKEPERRYPSGLALADDLTRFLEGKPVVAQPISRAERLWRWVKRHPAIAALTACVVVLLVGGSVVSTWFGIDAHQQANAAQRQEGLAKTAEAKALEGKRIADLRAAELTFQLGLQQAEAGAVDRGLFLMVRAWGQAPPDAVAFRSVIRANLAGWSRQLPRLRQAVQVDNAPQSVRLIAVGDPEGRTFLTWLSGQPIRRFDSSTGQPVALPTAVADRDLVGVSPEGRWLILGRGPARFLVDAVTGKEALGTALLARTGPPSCTELADVVVAADKEGQPIYWDLHTGKELAGRLRLLRGDEVRLTRTVEGRPVAVVFRGAGGQPEPLLEARVETIDLETGKLLSAPLSLVGGPNPTFTYDGRAAVTESLGSWRRRELTTGRLHDALWSSRRQANQQTLSRDGLEVLCGEIDRSLRTYDLATGLQRGGELLREPQVGAWGAGTSITEDPSNEGLFGGGTAGSPDGRLVFTLSRLGTARVWDTSLCRLQRTLATIPRRRLSNPSADHDIVRAAFSADGSRVLLSRRSLDRPYLLDARTSELLSRPLSQARGGGAAFSPDGRYLATTHSPGAPGSGDEALLVVLRDGKTGEPVGKPWVAPKLSSGLSFSPDGQLLAVWGVAGTFLLDVPANTLRRYLPEATCIHRLKWHADGRRLLVTARPGWPGVGSGLRVWDALTGQPLAPFRAAALGYLGPEATWLRQEELVSCEEKRGIVRLSSDGKDVLGTHDTGVLRLVHFSADGTRMAAGTSVNTVRQWETRTGKLLEPALAHPEPTESIRYSPSGKLLAVVCLDGSVRLWDADTGWPLGPTLLHVDVPVGLAFCDDERTLRIVTEAGVLHNWPVPQPIEDDLERFQTWMQARGGLRLEGAEPVQVSVAEWQSACRSLKERWPQPDAALAEPSDDLTPWHRQRALDAEAANNERGELYHLTRLAALCPREPALQARLARVHARVAGRLPAGPARDREWQRATEAVKRQQDWPRADLWAHLGARAAVARQAHDEALWYLDQLAARGGDWTVFAERAEMHRRAGWQPECDADLDRALTKGGNADRAFVLKLADERARRDRWPEVVTLLNLSLKLTPLEVSQLHRLALAHLKTGNQAAYADLCKAVLRQLPEKPNAPLAIEVIRICTLAPGALDNWERPLGLLAEAVRVLKEAEDRAGGDDKQHLAGRRREGLVTQGALLLRAGHSADALKALHEARQLAPGGEGGPVEWAWLALAHAANKADLKEARLWLDRAQAAVPKRAADGLWQAVLVEALVAEAVKTIKDKMGH